MLHMSKLDYLNAMAWGDTFSKFTRVWFWIGAWAVKDAAYSVDRAKAICEIGQVLVNSAKVEVDMMKHTDADGSGFMRNYNTKLVGKNK